MQEAGVLLAESSSPRAFGESLQSAEYSGTSSGKPKKRERPDETVTASKKGQPNEEYASPQKRECTEKVPDKDGGLVTSHGIEQLIVQMRQEQASSQRIKLAGVVMMTAKEDCLRKFVQMGGVAVLDDWIQDGLKSRPSDAGSKDGDKGWEEEMMMILLALEKLPIDLEALKGCSVGKSVKRLRSAKNGDLQRKARKLVDTWRKRVDFEMNQSSVICPGAHEHSAHLDSTSRSSDLSPGRAVESGDVPNVPAEVVPVQEVNGTLVSTLSNASTSDASPQAHEKSSISSDKDASRKMGRLCSISGSTLSPAKRHKQVVGFSTDKECKEEMVNTTDSQQKLKDRDVKGDNSTLKNEPNGNVASVTRKTNEYRKKLRSGGSSAALSSGDLLAPGSAAQTRDNTDDKKACIDNNTGDSEQVSKRIPAAKSANLVDSNEAPDPGLRAITTACKDQIPTETLPQGGKTEHVNESCLSSQSSCTDKRTKTSLMVTFDTTKTLSSHSLPQGDMAGGTQNHSASEPELKPLTTSTAVALPKRSETGDPRQGGAVEGEESCCSYDNGGENAKRGSAECPSSDGKDACLLDGVDHSESSKGIQESEKEQKLAEAAKKACGTPTTTHSCHEFDLNEGLAMEEFYQDSQLAGVPQGVSTSNAFAGSVKATSTLSAPVAISAASKGAFIPPLNSMNRCDIGWKGSAATSAFRPAEPRHSPAPKSQSPLPSNERRNVNSFDLNVADQGNPEDYPAPSGRQNNGAPLDLNADGGDVELQTSTPAAEIAKFLHSGSAEKHPDKRPVLDFDLNEQLNEALPEQETLSISAGRRFNTILPFGGTSGHAMSGDVISWPPAGSSPFPFGSANVPPRTDQVFTGSLNQPISSLRQTPSSTGGPPSAYLHTAPFFGGPQIPFPASFAYSSAPAGAELPYLGSKMAPNPIPLTVGGRPRPTETSLVRPAFGSTSTDDLRGGKDFYTWARPHQNVYGGGSRPPTLIGYNNAMIGGREHVVNFDGGAVLEEQMRLYQQAAVPVAPLKRKDSDYFSGLRQSTWH